MRINGRPRGYVRCPGPHPDKPGWRKLSDYLCGGCWAQLPRTTRRLLKAGVPAGASAARHRELLAALKDGKPLSEIEVSE